MEKPDIKLRIEVRLYINNNARSLTSSKFICIMYVKKMLDDFVRIIKNEDSKQICHVYMFVQRNINLNTGSRKKSYFFLVDSPQRPLGHIPFLYLISEATSIYQSALLRAGPKHLIWMNDSLSKFYPKYKLMDIFIRIQPSYKLWNELSKFTIRSPVFFYQETLSIKSLEQRCRERCREIENGRIP